MDAPTITAHACVYLGVLAILKIAPAGVVDRLVRVTVGVHVHRADGGREHDALDAGVCRRHHHVPCAPDCWLDHHLLQHACQCCIGAGG